MTDNEALIALLDIRQQITDCRAQGLHLTASTLRHKAMSLAETFVDPLWDTGISPERRAAEPTQDQVAIRKAVLFNIGRPQEQGHVDLTP